MERFPIGGREKGNQGDSYYTAPNPPCGAVITYYLAEGLKTLKKEREEREKELREEEKPVYYPDWEDLRREEREEKPTVILTITDEDGNIVRRLTGPASTGIHRVTWDLRYPAPNPVSLEDPRGGSARSRGPVGPMVVPGTFTVSLAKSVRGEITPCGEPQTFETVPLGSVTLAAADREALVAFQRQTARLQRAILGSVRAAGEAQNHLDHLKKALHDTPDAGTNLLDRVRALDERLKDLRIDLEGDRTISGHSEPTPPSITGRVSRIIWGHWSSTSAPTRTQRDSYTVAADAFAPVLAELRKLVEVDLVALEAELEAAGAPWTPGRVPRWER